MKLLQEPDFTVPAALGMQIQRQVRLAKFTTMKVGGPAEYFVTVSRVDQLLTLVRWAQRTSLPYFILGGGSNILISDAGIPGLVIYNRCRQVHIEAAAPDHQRTLFAESGMAMAGAARTSIKAGLAGLEWAVSVPGTVGGAVVGNAGAHGGEIKDNLKSALVLDEAGEVREYSMADFQYAYRNSTLKRKQPLQAGFKPVVLSANFRLVPGDPVTLNQRAEQFLAHRRQTQPVEPSLGSIFVNPPGDFAGRLIEAAGLKGAQRGGAAISRLHANFIVNPGGVGNATAGDVVALIAHVQEMVQQRLDVQLEPEVQLVGEWR